MQQPKRVLCLMDMAGAGRSSLGVVLPVLAACGVQGVPLPTALFSTHTGGFGTPVARDETEFCTQAAEHYVQQGLAFDAVYTGYLASEGQFRLAEAALLTWPDAFKVVDPAIADNGRLYSSLTLELAGKMRDLAQRADLITPNYTEAALLLGQAPSTAPPAPGQMESWLKALSAQCAVLVTSVPTQSGAETWGCDKNGENMFVRADRRAPQDYPGTGDLFAAAVTGLTLRGLPLGRAVQGAAAFVQAAAHATYEGGGEMRQGVWFEPCLNLLVRAAGEAP